MEREIIVKIAVWNSSETSIEIPELNYFKSFKHRIDAENWVNSIFKNAKFVNVLYS